MQCLIAYIHYNKGDTSLQENLTDLQNTAQMILPERKHQATEIV